MNIVWSLTPILFYFLILISLDSFKICRRTLLVGALLYGILASGIAYLIFTLWQTEQRAAAPIIEELLKGGMLVWLSAKKKMGFFVEGVTYGATIGAGFATIENILYVFGNPEMTSLVAGMRGVSTALLHIGCTGMVGAASVIIVRELREKRDINPWGVIALVYIPSMLIHYFHNSMVLSPFVLMLVMILFFGSAVLALYYYDDRLITYWFDEMMEGDITLLTSIQTGTLIETNAGKYLMSLHSSFNPEEIADIMACLTLHLELSVAAKSRMMLQEAQMAAPLFAEERELYKEKVVELRESTHRIGKRGVLALRHIITIHAFDEHAFRILTE